MFDISAESSGIRERLSKTGRVEGKSRIFLLFFSLSLRFDFPFQIHSFNPSDLMLKMFILINAVLPISFGVISGYIFLDSTMEYIFEFFFEQIDPVLDFIAMFINIFEIDVHLFVINL